MLNHRVRIMRLGAGRGALVLAMSLCGACLAAESPPVDFAKDVQPILSTACYSCHGSTKSKGNLRLDRKADALRGGDSGAVILPHRGAESLLIKLVRGEDPDRPMPAKGDALSAAQIATLVRWIDAGAAWPDDGSFAGADRKDHWAFKPIRRPTIPSDANNPIDAFIGQKLSAAGLQMSAPADRTDLLRRLYFDLTGLPPSPAEAELFLRDAGTDACERLVDRLLASPRFGERWGRHWLDVVRYAESNGFEKNIPRPTAWPYRDYVIRSFNEDKPYDQFVREQLAGDAMGTDAATEFLVAGPWDEVKSPDPVLTAQQRADELHDMVSTTATTFLGLTVGCARCHDHKFDPILQTDYYRMTAIFAGVQHGERPFREGKPSPVIAASQPSQGRPAVAFDRNEERFAPVAARFVRLAILATNNGAEPCIDELEVFSAGAGSRNVALASAGAKVNVSGTLAGYAIHQVAHLIDGQYGNEHSWISNQRGAGTITLELPGEMTIDRVVWGRDRTGKFKDRLATRYRVEVAVAAEGPWRVVASSEDRAPVGSATPAVPMVYAGKFVQPGPSYRLHRGDAMAKREEVTPGGIAAIGPALDLPANAPEQSRRLALADSLVHPDNPLLARVIVNRLWHYHFGKGLVATPGDFGHMGALPTHPELLDLLASELIANHWRLKPIHRLIVTSAAYRQSSAMREAARKVDADASLLWRYPPRRLEAEAIRDAVLAVSGKLDLRMGGPGFDVYKPNDNYVRIYEPREDFGAEHFRRMVYQFKPRLQPDGIFSAFDWPDGAQVTPRRSVSTTPLQALNLLNSGFMMQQSAYFAERLQRECGTVPGQIALGFQLAFARPPSEVESAAAARLIRAHGMAAFCRALFNANEFIYVH